MPVKLPNDPMRYIRRVRGRFEARPYDGVAGERRSLGTFASVNEAREAIKKYWWGKLEARPRYVFRVHSRDGDRFQVRIPVAGFMVKVGESQVTQEAAAKIAHEFLHAFYGVAVAVDLLRGKEKISSWAEKQARKQARKLSQ